MTDKKKKLTKEVESLELSDEELKEISGGWILPSLPQILSKIFGLPYTPRDPNKSYRDYIRDKKGDA